ncbi:hypothetical protein RAM80_16495 [Pseudomonas sp. App30]|uniref:hypothetical protein n=1 Tax=Pseudomonas sp. App30 TaxID=3068990 RepID=UPI003A8000FE
MSNVMPNFYVMKSAESDNQELSRYYEVDWLPELPLFDYNVETPNRQMFSGVYDVVVKKKELDVDVALDNYLVASPFLSLCDNFAVDYISVGVDVVLLEGKPVDKEFSLFFLKARVSILDDKQSIYTLVDESLLLPVAERLSTDPVYEKIESFVVKDGVSEDLFFCSEIKETVCSEKFKLEFQKQGLKGIKFIAIDAEFLYSPWDEF